MLHNVHSDKGDKKQPVDYDVYAPKESRGKRVPFSVQVAAIEKQFTQ